MASKLMVTLSQSPNIGSMDLNHLMTLLGRYFQIRDDYLNLASLEVSMEASRGTPQSDGHDQNRSLNQ